MLFSTAHDFSKHQLTITLLVDENTEWLYFPKHFKEWDGRCSNSFTDNDEAIDMLLIRKAAAVPLYQGYCNKVRSYRQAAAAGDTTPKLIRHTLYTHTLEERSGISSSIWARTYFFHAFFHKDSIYLLEVINQSRFKAVHDLSMFCFYVMRSCKINGPLTCLFSYEIIDIYRQPEFYYHILSACACYFSFR